MGAQISMLLQDHTLPEGCHQSRCCPCNVPHSCPHRSRERPREPQEEPSIHVLHQGVGAARPDAAVGPGQGLTSLTLLCHCWVTARGVDWEGSLEVSFTRLNAWGIPSSVWIASWALNLAQWVLPLEKSLCWGKADLWTKLPYWGLGCLPPTDHG